jgi:acylphosphatase
MEQRKCFEFTVKNKVQNVGLRLAIAKLIPDELDVRTDNLPNGSVRVVVKGHKQEVMEFWERLQKQLLGKAENPTFSQPAEMAEMSIETDRFFHKLQCEQMDKFVGVGLDMKSSIDSMSSKIDHMSFRLDTLPQDMARELAKLKKNGLL